MNKYERLFAWTTVAVLMLFTIGTCQKYDTHSDTEKDKRISELEFKFDSLQSLKSKEKIKIVEVEKAREVVKTVYKEKIVYVKGMDSVQHDSLFEALYAGRKDSANVKYFENEQCQKELALCDSSSKHKDTVIHIQEQQLAVCDTIGQYHKKEAEEQKKKREDDAYKLYLWKSIGKALIATDILVILTVIALR